jgi:hypothetical protein
MKGSASDTAAEREAAILSEDSEEAGAAELETLSEVATLETTETEDAAALLRYLPLYLMML